mmetsp:Transcript_6273/g.12404  ORF Transcript_6273/g.12404 Transcript_6273/m.12404 type:complete len:233 (+) Transcript_6273:287-985(+)
MRELNSPWLHAKQLKPPKSLCHRHEGLCVPQEGEHTQVDHNEDRDPRSHPCCAVPKTTKKNPQRSTDHDRCSKQSGEEGHDFGNLTDSQADHQCSEKEERSQTPPPPGHCSLSLLFLFSRCHSYQGSFLVTPTHRPCRPNGRSWRSRQNPPLPREGDGRIRSRVGPQWHTNHESQAEEETADEKGNGVHRIISTHVAFSGGEERKVPEHRKGNVYCYLSPDCSSNCFFHPQI